MTPGASSKLPQSSSWGSGTRCRRGGLQLGRGPDPRSGTRAPSRLDLCPLAGSCDPGCPERAFGARRDDVAAYDRNPRVVMKATEGAEEMFRTSRVLAGTGVVGALVVVWLALSLGGVFTSSGATSTTTAPAATSTASKQSSADPNLYPFGAPSGGVAVKVPPPPTE